MILEYKIRTLLHEKKIIYIIFFINKNSEIFILWLSDVSVCKSVFK